MSADIEAAKEAALNAMRVWAATPPGQRWGRMWGDIERTINAVDALLAPPPPEPTFYAFWMTKPLPPEFRSAFEKSYGGGIVGYVQRIRDGHGPTFRTDSTGTIISTGCKCGEVGCRYPAWLIHCADLIAAYNGKVADLAAETSRHGVNTVTLEPGQYVMHRRVPTGGETLARTDGTTVTAGSAGWGEVEAHMRWVIVREFVAPTPETET